MRQVNFVEDNLLKNFTWSILEYFVPYFTLKTTYYLNSSPLQMF